jgi:AcrR family transcriptional regulator
MGQELQAQEKDAGVGRGVRLDDDKKREPLTRRRIVEAALRLVDDEGLETLTMRRLGAELGFEAMSLYRHFPNKAALLDYVVEAVWAEMELPSSEGDPWKTLEGLARAFRRLAHSHPNIFPVLAARPVALRGAMRPVELTLGALRETGCDEGSATHAFRYLVGYVYGYVQREMADRATTEEPDAQQWYDLRRVPPDVFPAIVHAAPYFAGYDFDAGFDWGLRAALAGLKAQLP